MDFVFDCLFLTDILIAFRTAYYDVNSKSSMLVTGMHWHSTVSGACVVVVTHDSKNVSGREYLCCATGAVVIGAVATPSPGSIMIGLAPQNIKGGQPNRIKRNRPTKLSIRSPPADQVKIAKNYFCGFFIIDLISSIPYDAILFTSCGDTSGANRILKSPKVRRCLTCYENAFPSTSNA